MENTKKITGVGLLLAVMIIFQSLRIFIPIPPWINTFVIGSLVNMCLLVTLKKYGFSASLLLGVVAPMVASLQGLLIHPILIFPVALANISYIVLFKTVVTHINWVGVGLVSGVGKMVVLLTSFYYLLPLLAIPDPMAQILLFVMSWPQIITGFLGVALSFQVEKKLTQS